MFGPTNERETRPARPRLHDRPHARVWCRPCMLRECPLDHRCMRGIDADAAVAGGATRDRERYEPTSAGCLPRSRRHAHRGSRLSGSAGACRALPVDRRRDPRAESRRSSASSWSPISRASRADFFDEAGRRTRCIAHIADLLAAGGAHIDAYYYCPHHPDGTVPEFARACDCRKPARGLVDRAAARPRHRSVARSFAVGDRWLDVGLGANGRRAGRSWSAPATARTRSGVRRPASTADAIVDNLGRRSAGSPEVLNSQSNSESDSLMQLARSVHPLPGEAERKARLLGAGRRASPDAACSSSAISSPTSSSTARWRGSRAKRRCSSSNTTRRRSWRAAPATRRTTSRRSAAARALAGLVGADPEGAPAARQLSTPASIARASCARSSYRTPVKTRILAGGVHSAKQQVVRIDRETGLAAGRRRSAARSPGSWCRRWPTATPCILSDYGSGSRDARAGRRHPHALERRSRRRADSGPLDSRYRLLDYRGLTACTPNESEVEQVARHPHRRRRRRCSSAPGARCCSGPDAGGAHHARQPRHGAVRAAAADHAHSHLRIRRSRRRHRRRRHGHRDVRRSRWPQARRSTRPRAWPTTPADSS